MLFIWPRFGVHRVLYQFLLRLSIPSHDRNLFIRPNPVPKQTFSGALLSAVKLELTIKTLSAGSTKHSCAWVARLRSRGTRPGRWQTTFSRTALRIELEPPPDFQ